LSTTGLRWFAIFRGAVSTPAGSQCAGNQTEKCSFDVLLHFAIAADEAMLLPFAFLDCTRYKLPALPVASV